MHTYLPAERQIFLKFSQVKCSPRKTLLIFNMIKVEVKVGAGGRGKLRKRWVRVEAMVLEKIQRNDTFLRNMHQVLSPCMKQDFVSDVKEVKSDQRSRQNICGRQSSPRIQMSLMRRKVNNKIKTDFFSKG